MKYACHIPADQTILYLTGKRTTHKGKVYDMETVSHKEAKLWDTKEELEKWINVRRLLGDGDEFYIEEVEDENEFRSREDTW